MSKKKSNKSRKKKKRKKKKKRAKRPFFSKSHYRAVQQKREDEAAKAKEIKAFKIRKTFTIHRLKFSEGGFSIGLHDSIEEKYEFHDDRIKKIFNTYIGEFKKYRSSNNNVQLFIDKGRIKAFDAHQEILKWFFNYHKEKTGEDLLNIPKQELTKPNRKPVVKQESKKADELNSNKPNKPEQAPGKTVHPEPKPSSKTLPKNPKTTLKEKNSNKDKAKPLFRKNKGWKIYKVEALNIIKQIKEECHNERYWPSKSTAFLKFVVDKKLKECWVFNTLPQAYKQSESLGGGIILTGGGKYNVTTGGLMSKNEPTVTNILSSIDQKRTFTLKDNRQAQILELTTFKYYQDNPREVVLKIPGTALSLAFPHLKAMTERVKRMEKVWTPIHEIQLKDLPKEAGKEKAKAQFRDLKVVIRDRLELRHQNILNSDQNDIKRSHIYDGKTMVIDGGPGTGKTSALIQRIKLLIENREFIKEYNQKLSNEQLDRINTEHHQWIFIAPTPLLAEYLKSNMQNEGLDVGKENLKDWPAFFSNLAVEYDLIKEVDDFPEQPELFFKESAFSKIQEDFEKAFTKHLISHFVAPIQGKGFRPVETKELVDDIYWERGDTKSLKGLSTLRFRYDKVRNKLSDRINYVKKVRNELRKKFITTCLRGAVDQLTINDLIYIDSFIDSLSKHGDGEDEIYNSLSKIITEQAESIFKKKEANLTPFEQKLGKIFRVREEISEENLFELGEYIVFVKRTSIRFTKPFHTFYFSKIVSFYKQKYRKDKEVLESFSSFGADDKKLPNLRIDELALLVSFVNEKVIQYHKDYKGKYHGIYMEHKRVVIAVDEATDLSLFEIACIYSLRDQLVHSVNFCGDLFQRTTERGIDNWELLFESNQKFTRHNLKVSYRQSPSLIDLAAAIYKKFNEGTEPDYQAHMARFSNEPKPQLFINSSQDERLKWTFDYIDVISKAYSDVLPSTAIFVTNSGQAEIITSYYDRHVKTDHYKVRSYSKEHKLEPRTVNIFELKDIKGLEFEAVIFFDLDDILSENINPSLVLHYLYVGLTRAAFYFGVSAKKRFRGKLSFLNEEMKIAN